MRNGVTAFPAIVIERDADDGETFRGVGAFEFREPGDLLFAAMAPGGPEIEQDDPAAILLERNRLALAVLERELGRGFALIGRCDGGADRGGWIGSDGKSSECDGSCD